MAVARNENVEELVFIGKSGNDTATALLSPPSPFPKLRREEESRKFWRRGCGILTLELSQPAFDLGLAWLELHFFFSCSPVNIQ